MPKEIFYKMGNSIQNLLVHILGVCRVFGPRKSSSRRARINLGAFGQNVCRVFAPFGRELGVCRKSCTPLNPPTHVKFSNAILDARKDCKSELLIMLRYSPIYVTLCIEKRSEYCAHNTTCLVICHFFVPFSRKLGEKPLFSVHNLLHKFSTTIIIETLSFSSFHLTGTQ